VRIDGRISTIKVDETGNGLGQRPVKGSVFDRYGMTCHDPVEEGVEPIPIWVVCVASHGFASSGSGRTDSVGTVPRRGGRCYGRH
jgi:hypothetical protein